MDKLWDTSCTLATANDVKHMTSLGLKSNLGTAAEEKTFYYQRGIKDTKNEKPILVLLHGYPQTSFMYVPASAISPTVADFQCSGGDM